MLSERNERKPSEEKKRSESRYRKPGFFSYSLARFAAFFVSRLIFKRKILRNEIRRAKGPYVVIANHEAALDFVNLIGATPRRLTFVVSNSFFSTLPVQGVMRRMHVIPKQQFQTELSDLRRMKDVVDSGNSFVIYPAGMMSENGLSTPIPEGTWQFLRWLGVDVYMAKTVGTYFAMPKWAGGFRRGRTYLDIYKLFGKEELSAMPVEDVRRRAEEALFFDAYREQEKYKVLYKGNHRVQGLENVLYMCPICGKEFSIRAAGENELICDACGFSEKADAFGFLHAKKKKREIRYVSDWSSRILERQRKKIGKGFFLRLKTAIRTIDPKKHKFRDSGEGVVTLTDEKLILEGKVGGEPLRIEHPSGAFPILPFSPGKHFEIQNGKEIYRCLPEDGRQVMKFIDALKILHERSAVAAKAK